MSSDLDPDDIGDDPDKLSLVTEIAKALAEYAHAYGEAAGMADPPPHWAQLDRLQQNLRLAGVIAIARHRHTLLVELVAVIVAAELDAEP